MKRFISSFLIITIILTSVYVRPVKANTLFDTYRQTIQDLLDNVKTDANNTAEDLKQTIVNLWRGVGYIVNPALLGSDLARLYNYLRNNHLLGLDENSSDQDCIDAYLRTFKQNVNVNSNNVIISDSFNTVNKGMQNVWSGHEGYFYLYSASLMGSLNYFSSGDMYNAYRQLVNQYQSNYYCLIYEGNNTARVIMFKMKPDLVGLWDGSINNPDAYGFRFYSLNGWSPYQFSSDEALRFEYDSNSKTFVSLPIENWPYTKGSASWAMPAPGSVWNVSVPSNAYHVFLNNNNSVIKVYKTLTDLQNGSQGVQPFYVTNTWNTYNNLSGDYTLTNSNVNNISYDNVGNYINDSYNTNGSYPDSQDIQIYIDNNIPVVEPTPTPTPIPGGGGSGGSGSGTTVSSNGVNVVINNNPTASNTNNNTYTDNSTTNNNYFFNLLHGGTVSGNGTGNGSGTVSGNGSGTSGNIFDWLGDLGEVLGNLIKNLGEALLNVIKGITDLIEAIVVGLPTMFFEFIGAVFGWLPEEWVSLLSLSLASMLIYGIIKIFRG